MSNNHSLTNLTLREAVTDGLHRAVMGIDTQDAALYKSAIFPGSSTYFEVVGSSKTVGSDAINEYILTKIIPIPTLHQLSSIRIEVEEGAKEARLTCTAVAWHYKQEDAFVIEQRAFVTAGFYDVVLGIDESDGLWKIKGWKLMLNWTEGDRKVIVG